MRNYNINPIGTTSVPVAPLPETEDARINELLKSVKSVYAKYDEPNFEEPPFSEDTSEPEDNFFLEE